MKEYGSKSKSGGKEGDNKREREGDRERGQEEGCMHSPNTSKHEADTWYFVQNLI